MTSRFAWPPKNQPSPRPAEHARQPLRDQPPNGRAGSVGERPRPAGVIASLEDAFLGTPGLALGGPVAWIPEPTEACCPRCGRTVGAGEVSPEDGRCPGCRPERIRWDRFIRLGEYEGQLREAVLQTKYGRWRKQGHLLGQLIGRRLAEVLGEMGSDRDSAIITPVPMPASRRFRRGIDHALVIARGASASSGVRLARLLSRLPGPSQVSVAPSARPANLRGKIRLRLGIPPWVSTVVLIDDVRTTGATADACCRTLREQAGRGLSDKAPEPGDDLRIVLAVAAAASADTNRRPTG